MSAADSAATTTSGPVPEHLRQSPYRVRFDWGMDGLRALRTDCEVLIVVDVLSFGTSVDVVIAAGARVLPLPWRDERAAHAAERAGAVLAGARDTERWSLSPSSLRSLPPETLLALPSPNGATLCASGTGSGATVFAGCLRNAGAVASAAAEAAADGPIGVVAAGERRPVEGAGLRFAIEDLLGAGAIIGALGEQVGSCSPEAGLAAACHPGSSGLRRALLECSSGRELESWGFGHDVELAAEIDGSVAAPVLRGEVMERWTVR